MADLHKRDFHANPFQQFQSWFAEATQIGQPMPEAMSLSGRFPLLLRVVDEAGRTLPDAVVRTTGVNFEGGDTAESWGADWRVSDHRTVDGGLVLLEIEPADAGHLQLTPETAVWLDIECEGYQPIRNHRYQISAGLPIRLQR